MTRPREAGVLWVLAASVLWGTTGTAAAQAPLVSPLALGAAAMGLGGLLRAATARRAVLAHRTGLRHQWLTLAVSACAVGVYPLAFYSSMRLAGVAVGTVVSIGSAPTAAALVERLVAHQPLSRRWTLGATVGVVGVVALAAGQAGPAGPASGEAHRLLGILLALLAGITYAIYSWGATRIMRSGVPPDPVMGAVFGLGGLLLLPVLLATGAPIVHSVHSLAVAAYMAVIPMFLGYVLFGRGLAATSASTATAVSLLEPAVATVLALLVLRERLALVAWAGMAAIAVSLLILTFPPPRRARKPSAPSGPAGANRQGETAPAAITTNCS